MHSEKKIVKYSLVAIIIGLAGIYLASIYIEPGKVALSEIDERFLGKFISTEGVVKEAKLSNTSTLFLTLESNDSKLTVVVFGSLETEISKGDFVIVKGELSRYRGEMELIAKGIRKV